MEKKNKIQSEVVMEYKNPFAMPSLNFEDDEHEEGISGDDRQDDPDEEDVEGISDDGDVDGRGLGDDDNSDGEEFEDTEESEEEDDEGSEESEEYEDDGDDGEDDEPESKELYGGIARLLMQDGFLPSDYKAEDITPDKLYQDIVNKIKEEGLHAAEQEAISQGYTEETLKYANLLAQGIDPNILKETTQYKMLSEMETEDQDNAEFLVKQMYVAKNYSEKDIDRIMTKVLEDDTLDSEVEDAKAFFDEKYKTSIKKQEEEKQLLVEQQKKQYQEYKDQVKKIVFEDNIPGLEKEEEKNKFIKDLFEPTETYEYEENGKKVRSKISKYQKMRLDFDNDLSKQLILARKILIGDFNDSEAFEEGKAAVAEEIFTKVVKRQAKKGSRPQREAPKSRIQSSEVFSYQVR